jgi:FAD/FMN-containing dehydrogenase
VEATVQDPRLLELRRRLPQLRVLTARADLAYYGQDWTRRWIPDPLAVALPADTAEVQGVVRWANEQHVAIVPSGGRTGLSGGAVAANGELVLSLTRMQRVLEFNPIDRLLRVQPGLTLEAAQAAAREHGLIYPVDLGSRGSCSIGGNIATNAGGLHVIRHGNTRAWIAGLKVVTGTGDLLDLNRGLVKDASGYDLRQLMIGSEGTLGVVVEALLKLTAPLPASQVMLLGLPGADALMQVFELFRARVTLQAFEFFSDRALQHVLDNGVRRALDGEHAYYVVVEFDAALETERQAGEEAFGLAQERGWVDDGVVAQSAAQAAALWRLREGITEALAPRGPYKIDVSVRVAAMPQFMREVQDLLQAAFPQLEVVWFGHIGDGNLHINLLPPKDMGSEAFGHLRGEATSLLAAAFSRHGGSISAEHGIGLVKREYLSSSRSAAEIALMRGIRASFDPNGILNPGKLFTAD